MYYLGRGVLVAIMQQVHKTAPIQLGESITLGYWNNNEIYEKLSATHFDSVLNDASQKRYLKIGDFGFLHENELYICGMVKDLIVIKGDNFYSQDLERGVAHSHKAIVLTAVASF